MQIVDKGSKNKADTVKSNDQVLVRFMEYSILDKDTTLSNLAAAETVDEFRYTVTSSSIAGTFLQGYMMTYYSSPAVPAGWLVPLSYVRDMAHVQTDCSFQDGASDSHAVCLSLLLRYPEISDLEITNQNLNY